MRLKRRGTLRAEKRGALAVNAGIVTSASNARVKWLKSLAVDARTRRSEGLWLVEGVRFVEDALDSGRKVALVVSDNGDASPRRAELIEKTRKSGTEMLHVTREVFLGFTDTRTPQGICAVVEAPRWTTDQVTGGAGPVVVLDRPRDPGNLGTIMRSALASGASGLVLAGDSVDPGNPKALRASAGAALRLPFIRVDDPGDVRGVLGRPLYATGGSGGRAPWDMSLAGPCAVLLGQEAEGIGSGWKDEVDAHITIPMATGVESLNLAAAAAVILFEAARQRAEKTMPRGSAP